MKRQKRYLIIYSAALFGVALTLIAVSYLSMTKDINATSIAMQGAQNSLSQLTIANDALKAEKAMMENQTADLTSELEETKRKLEQTRVETERNSAGLKSLIKAMQYFEVKNYQAAKSELENVDVTLLDEDSAKILKELSTQITKSIQKQKK